MCAVIVRASWAFELVGRACAFRAVGSARAWSFEVGGGVIEAVVTCFTSKALSLSLNTVVSAVRTADRVRCALRAVMSDWTFS